MTTSGLPAAERSGSLRASVVTMTPSPAVDRVYLVDTMRSGEVNRASRVHSFLSGKGINVAKNLRNAGGTAVAVTMLADGDRHLVGDDDLFRVVPAPTPARVNTVVVSCDGATTNVNERPRPLSEESWAVLCAATAAAIRERSADWLVVAGSIPSAMGRPGALRPAQLARDAADNGTRLCLDSGGAVLREWLSQGFVPDLVKPNLAELGAAVGRELHTMADAVAASRSLIDRGTGAVLASLGGDGALLVTPAHELWARPPRVDVVNTTGAGDAALAGFVADLVGGGSDDRLEASLRRAVAWGSHAVREIEAVPRSHPDLLGIDVDEPPLALRLDIRS
ncbi:1-phosphofructokinase [Microbacterium gilvum]|uniref:1-phosphofructokinase n=2 Tax=Microbacterium gilvum TaxID=1336204 RepID=A0ABP9A0X1_9MICO